MLDFSGSSGTPAGPFLPFRPASLFPRDPLAIPGDLTPPPTGPRPTRCPGRTIALVRVCASVLEGLVVHIDVYLPFARLRRA